MPSYLERVLLVVGPQNTGKSTVLRSMFRDRRLGLNGIPPPSSQKNLADVYHLSNERKLYLRLTSPHEYGDTKEEFIEKIRNKMHNDDGRWNFAGAMQPDAFSNMPDVVACVSWIHRKLTPERIRVAFLDQNPLGVRADVFVPGRDLTDELHGLQLNVEVVLLDSRRRGVNGLVLSDFFDFT